MTIKLFSCSGLFLLLLALVPSPAHTTIAPERHLSWAAEEAKRRGDFDNLFTSADFIGSCRPYASLCDEMAGSYKRAVSGDKVIRDFEACLAAKGPSAQACAERAMAWGVSEWLYLPLGGTMHLLSTLCSPLYSADPWLFTLIISILFPLIIVVFIYPFWVLMILQIPLLIIEATIAYLL